MASSLLHSLRGRRNGSSSFHDIEQTVEEQLDTLRGEIASLANLVGRNSRQQGARLRDTVSSYDYDDLIERGENMLRDLQHGYARGSREVRETVRRHPLATLGAAAVVGIALTMLARR